MSRKPAVWSPCLLIAALLVPGSGAAAQDWTTEELRERIQDFHQEGLLARLRQISQLLQNREQATNAICATIHGDYREYLLKIESVLDQLADERWLTREEAERTLVEIGARAMTQIGERAKSGVTHEEQVRSTRILDAIAARGTEEEQAEIRLLRGLVSTAAYLEPSEKLIRALVSAMGHTDPLVVEGAVRALGAVGTDAQTAMIAGLLVDQDQVGANMRRVALQALGRVRGARAVARAGELLRSGKLSDAESAMLLVDLRTRPDAVELMTELAGHRNPVIAKLAALRLPPAESVPSPAARFTLADRTELNKPFLGLSGAGIAVAYPVDGMPRGEIPFGECDVIEFGHPVVPLAAGTTRLFLTQGSLVTGELTRIDPETVSLHSQVFGDLKIARAEIQGVALDVALDRLVGASSEHDRIRLRTGEMVDGEVRSLGDEGLALRAPDGSHRTIPAADVAGVLFRRPSLLEQDNEIYSRVDLTNGDRLLVHLAAVRPDRAAFYVPLLGTAIVPTTQVARIEFGVGGGALWGFTLIADYSDNRIIEVDDQGREVFALEEVYGAWDVECLDNGNLLITEFALNRVVEVTRSGNEVWSYEELKNPYDADRLPNGNTLIADTFGERVVEVNSAGEIVWLYQGGIKPYDVNRLTNGNTLIADGRKDRVIEVDRTGNVVWELPNMPSVHDVDRLPNGNTLITQRTLHRVIEVDRDGKIVSRIDNLSSPSDADRLPNGHTLVAENGRVREFDRRGNVVWEKEIAWAVEVNRY